MNQWHSGPSQGAGKKNKADLFMLPSSNGSWRRGSEPVLGSHTQKGLRCKKIHLFSSAERRDNAIPYPLSSRLQAITSVLVSDGVGIGFLVSGSS